MGLFVAFAFILGLCFGSFANVCIYRIPRGLNISKPRSACRKCKKPIAWHNNIPLVSYLLLKGKCARCGDKISIEYPLIELITGIAFAVLFLFYGFSAEFFLFCLVSFALVAISGIDFEFKIIPDEFSIGLIILGLLTSFINPAVSFSPVKALLGIIAGGGFLYAAGIFGKMAFKKEAMGGGDVKLMAGIGAFLGFGRVMFAIFLASCIAAAVGIILISFKKNKRLEQIPFGPYLAGGSFAAMLLDPLVVINNILQFEMALLQLK